MKSKSVIIILLLCSARSHLAAQSTNWAAIPADQNWANAVNWSVGVPAVYATNAKAFAIGNASNGLFPIIQTNSYFFGAPIANLFEPSAVGSGTSTNARLDIRSGSLSRDASNPSIGNLYVAASGSGPVLNLANTAVTAQSNLTSYGQGSGSMNIRTLTVGAFVGSSGTVNINTTGSLSALNFFFIGNQGTGVMNLTSGNVYTTNPANGMAIGVEPSGIGTVTMEGGALGNGSAYKLGYITIGRKGTATLNQTGGSMNIESTLRFAENVGSTGSANISGGSASVNDLQVGAAGTGTLTVSNTGSVTVRKFDDSTVIGGNAGAIGNVNLNGGSLTTRLVRGGAGTSTFNFNGGTLVATHSHAGFFQGLTQANILSGGARIDTVSNDVTIAQNLQGAGGLTKLGSGILTLSGTNTYMGGTTINGGKLALGSSNTLPSLTNLSIGSAELTPSNGINYAIGTLDVTGSATINLGAANTSLAFANSSAIDWTSGTLNITGSFVSGSSIRFGTNNGGLSATQLALITVESSGCRLDPSGYLTTDITPPTLAGSNIVDNKGSSPVYPDDEVIFTITFSEDIDHTTLDASDFTNAGTSMLVIGAINETAPGVFTVRATVTSSGTLSLSVKAGAVITDAVGNPLNTATAIADDGTLQINLPLPWSAQDIGTGMQIGTTVYGEYGIGKFVQAGSGLIGGTSDKFRFTYQMLTDDGAIVAKISDLQNTGSSARVGVMIRESLASNSKHVFFGLDSSGAYRFASRSATGGSTSTNTNLGSGSVPNTWVCLYRTGNTIEAYKSTNGATWTFADSIDDTGGTRYIGLAVGSGSDTTLNTSQFSNVSTDFKVPSTQSFQQGTSQLVVYPDVPTATPSNQYRIRVRSAATNQKWKPVFATITNCKEASNAQTTDTGYWPKLVGWSHTYANIEMNSPVEVEISKANGQPITSGLTRPLNKTGPVTFSGGKAFFTISNPAQITLDVNGQMDYQHTGMGYTGPPIHAVSIFANPLLQNRPDPNGSDVYAVEPGNSPPSDGSWKTLYFKPGVHNIGTLFALKTNRDYYIPGDAIVYGSTIYQAASYNETQNIKIHGYGTLSGELFARGTAGVADTSYKPISVWGGARNVQVIGVTIADPAYHSVNLSTGGPSGLPNVVRWTKIIGWRKNGDGINPYGNTLIEDTFIRTQDDCTYVNGVGMNRLVLWNDANGSSFVLSAIPARNLVIENCDVIYSRASHDKWNGGRVFSLRGEPNGAGVAGGTGVIFRNINIEDPKPTLQQFFICTQVPAGYGPVLIRASGDISNVLFENIKITAPGVRPEPQILWGNPNSQIRNFTFKNLTVSGVKATSPSFFQTNGFVTGLIFQ